MFQKHFIVFFKILGDLGFFQELSATGDLTGLVFLEEIDDFETFGDSVCLQRMYGFGTLIVLEFLSALVDFKTFTHKFLVGS